MKNIIFIENHKNYNTMRLGMCVAHSLQQNGEEVILAGRRGKMPLTTGMRLFEFGLTTKPTTIAATFTKEKATRIICVASLTACEAAFEANLPYIYIEPENFKEEKPYKNKRTWLNKAQKVIVVGTGNKVLDKKRYGTNAVRVQNPAIAVVHNSKTKPTCFKKPNNVLAAGKLTKEGGFDALLKVWAQLAPVHRSWHLTLWGDGTNKNALQNFITSHNLQDSTEIVDASTDLSKLISSADIYVHPSTSTEGVDSILDALASRLPVVASDRPTVRNYIKNEVNGYLVPAKETKTWANTLDKLMVDWGKRVGIALEAEKTKSRFSTDVFVTVLNEKK